MKKSIISKKSIVNEKKEREEGVFKTKKEIDKIIKKEKENFLIYTPIFRVNVKQDSSTNFTNKLFEVIFTSVLVSIFEISTNENKKIFIKDFDFNLDDYFKDFSHLENSIETYVWTEVIVGSYLKLKKEIISNAKKINSNQIDLIKYKDTMDIKSIMSLEDHIDKNNYFKGVLATGFISSDRKNSYILNIVTIMFKKMNELKLSEYEDLSYLERLKSTVSQRNSVDLFIEYSLDDYLDRLMDVGLEDFLLLMLK